MAVTVSLVELLVMEEGRRKKLLMVHDSVFRVNGFAIRHFLSLNQYLDLFRFKP